MPEASLPEFLKPRLRLFMSIDLVGSTALKQSGRFPIKAPGGSESLRDVGPHWFIDISSFYSEIQSKFARRWQDYCQNIALRHNYPTGPTPELWKSNGDELIYVKELENSLECTAAISCWLEAGKEYRKTLKTKNSKLDVKMSAWTAGFPISNTEVIFQSETEKFSVEFGDQPPEILHYRLLEKWHLGEMHRRGLVRDFIGPSIDTGFRISGRATARKFTIGLELAFLLSHTGALNDMEEIVLSYDGPEMLKGVLGGKPYPLFWIDTMHDDALTQLGDEISTRSAPNLSKIKSFCAEFVNQHDNLMLRPFIQSPSERMISLQPENYEKLLHYMASQWLKAKISYDIELNLVEAPTDGPEGENRDGDIDLSLDLPPAKDSNNS